MKRLFLHQVSILMLTIIMVASLSELNAQIYDYSPGFDAGKTKEIDKLKFLEGDWDIKLLYTVEKYKKDPKWLPYATTESKFISLFNGSFYKEIAAGFPIQPEHEGFKAWEYETMISYDRYNKVYRFIFSDNILALSDIYEGNFITNENDDSELIVSNLNTSTRSHGGSVNAIVKNRTLITDIKEDSFVLTWQIADVTKIENTKPEDIPWRWGPRE